MSYAVDLATNKGIVTRLWSAGTGNVTLYNGKVRDTALLNSSRPALSCTYLPV